MSTRTRKRREFAPPPPGVAFWRLREVVDKVGLSRASVLRAVARGAFPSPVRLTPGRVGFSVEAVERWISSRSGR